MKVRRDISSIPLRTAVETWRRFQDLVMGSGSVDAGQLSGAETVMTTLVTDEVFQKDPLTLVGVGARLVVYTFHGPDAMAAGPAVDKLSWNPTAGDWKLFVPCPEDQVDWVTKALASRAPRFVVHKPGSAPITEKEDGAQTSLLQIDWDALVK